MGFAFRDDEVLEIEKALKAQEEEQDVDRALLKVKGLLLLKKKAMEKTKYGQLIYEVLARRKIKFCTSSIHFMVEKATTGRHDPRSLVPERAVRLFQDIRNKMEKYLVHIKVKWMDQTE